MKKKTGHKSQRKVTVGTGNKLFPQFPHLKSVPTQPSNKKQAHPDDHVVTPNSVIHQSNYRSMVTPVDAKMERISLWSRSPLLKRSHQQNHDVLNERNIATITESADAVIMNPKSVEAPALNIRSVDQSDQEDEEGGKQSTSRSERLIRDLNVEHELQEMLSRLRRRIENEIDLQQIKRSVETSTGSVPEKGVTGDNILKNSDNQQFLNHNMQNL